VNAVRFCLVLAVAVLAGHGLAAAERIPPAPPRHFNDYAGVVSRATAERLDARLAQFERDSSNQLVVALYPRMESGSSVEDYTVRVAQAWRAGQASRNNGAVLFAFMQERQLYIQVGYGLEGALPDAIAKRIIEQEIVPRFRSRDIDGGMTAAVEAMIAATQGEYKGTGRTQAQARGARSGGSGGGMIAGIIAIIIILTFVSFVRRALRNPMVLVNPRRRLIRPVNPWWLGGGGGGFGGGGGWSGGGGGGFSGGGGSFGGGGAGGKW
jgi:uncharacterized protein